MRSPILRLFYIFRLLVFNWYWPHGLSAMPSFSLVTFRWRGVYNILNSNKRFFFLFRSLFSNLCISFLGSLLPVQTSSKKEEKCTFLKAKIFGNCLSCSIVFYPMMMVISLMHLFAGEKSQTVLEKKSGWLEVIVTQSRICAKKLQSRLYFLSQKNNFCAGVLLCNKKKQNY